MHRAIVKKGNVRKCPPNEIKCSTKTQSNFVKCFALYLGMYSQQSSAHKLGLVSYANYFTKPTLQGDRWVALQDKSYGLSLLQWYRGHTHCTPGMLDCPLVLPHSEGAHGVSHGVRHYGR